jgi:hypothetical protein
MAIIFRISDNQDRIPDADHTGQSPRRRSDGGASDSEFEKTLRIFDSSDFGMKNTENSINRVRAGERNEKCYDESTFVIFIIKVFVLINRRM